MSRDREAYLGDDDTISLPQDDYFDLVTTLVDGLRDIAMGGGGPSIQLQIIRKPRKVTARLKVVSGGKKFTRNYNCLVNKDGNWELPQS